MKLATMSLIVMLLALPAVARAQGPVSAPNTDGLTKAIHILDNYRVVPNITYLTANNYDAKLDIYQARNTTTPTRRSFMCMVEAGRAARRNRAG